MIRGKAGSSGLDQKGLDAGGQIIRASAGSSKKAQKVWAG